MTDHALAGVAGDPGVPGIRVENWIRTPWVTDSNESREVEIDAASIGPTQLSPLTSSLLARPGSRERPQDVSTTVR